MPQTVYPKIEIPLYLENIQGCVFKLYYGNYYIVVMGRSLKWQSNMISGDIERCFRGKSVGALYLSFSKKVSSTPGLEFRFELLFESDNPYQLLKRTQEELDDALSDPYCLNSSFEPYLSSRIQTPPIYSRWKDKYWINRGHYLNFRKWQYSRYVV